MKKYLLILIILLFVGCIKQQRNDCIADIYNFSSPEKWSFELATKTILPDGNFDPEIPDSTKMYKLNDEVTMQLLKIQDILYNESNIQSTSTFFLDFKLYYKTCRFFIYGKLDLQTNIKSFVIWEFDQDTVFNKFNSRSLWLFNIKNDKLCSVARLAFSFDEYADLPPGSKTYLKNGVFTSISKGIAHISFWTDPVAAYQERREVKTYFTNYKVNENGFIEFVKKDGN